MHPPVGTDYENADPTGKDFVVAKIESRHNMSLPNGFIMLSLSKDHPKCDQLKLPLKFASSVRSMDSMKTFQDKAVNTRTVVESKVNDEFERISKQLKSVKSDVQSSIGGLKATMAKH